MHEQVVENVSEPVQLFEDKRWTGREQAAVWRHRIGLQLITEEPVLDVGGGDGLLLSMLRERGFQKLSMIDISPVAVEKARAAGIDARQGTLTAPLPFPDNAFGTACALDVLEHLYDPIPVLREMARVARSVVIVVPNFHYWKDRVSVLCGRVPFSCKPRRGHVYWFNYQTLADILRAERLQIDRFAVASFSRLGPVGPWLARTRPSLFAYSFGLKLRRPMSGGAADGGSGAVEATHLERVAAEPSV